MTYLWVAIGGFFGAIARFKISGWLNGRRVFPWGTFLINVSGSFLLGLLIGADVRGSWQLLLGTGFMGAFTTFSTFHLEAIRLWLNRQGTVSLYYLLASYVLGLACALAGLELQI